MILIISFILFLILSFLKIRMFKKIDKFWVFLFYIIVYLYLLRYGIKKENKDIDTQYN